jgi:hypothetical protein
MVALKLIIAILNTLQIILLEEIIVGGKRPYYTMILMATEEKTLVILMLAMGTNLAATIQQHYLDVDPPLKLYLLERVTNLLKGIIFSLTHMLNLFYQFY